jgi:hypothetical protein
MLSYRGRHCLRLVNILLTPLLRLLLLLLLLSPDGVVGAGHRGRHCPGCVWSGSQQCAGPYDHVAHAPAAPAAAAAAAVLLQMVLSVLGIAGGTALAAYGEVHNSVLGLVIMFGSEVLEATRLVMTQLLLAGHKMGPFEGLMWMVRVLCLLGGVSIGAIQGDQGAAWAVGEATSRGVLWGGGAQGVAIQRAFLPI